MALTDTHCHLDLEQFDIDRTAVIRRAAEAGVRRILVPSLTAASSRAAVNLAETDPMIRAAVGVHPNEAESWDGQTIPALRNLAAESLAVVAIGEIGLDFYRDRAQRADQISILKEQLGLASELELPVVVHCREREDAEEGACAEDLIGILEEWVSALRSGQAALAQRPGVLHSFSGSLEMARRAIDLGFYIGVTGPITYKNAERKRQVISTLPLERLLIETDAPYLAPEPHRGKRNEPAFVTHIADRIAELKSRTPQEIAAATTENAARLFSWGETV